MVMPRKKNRAPADPEQVVEQKRKPPSTAYPPGVSGNPSGRPKRVPMDPDPLGGEVTAARMKRVLGQDSSSDAGPTEKALRGWLEKDPKGFTGEIERRQRAEGADADREAELVRLRAENADLRAQLAGDGDRGDQDDDPGADAHRERCFKILREAAGE